MGEGPSGAQQLRIVASGGLEIWCGSDRVDGRIPLKASLLIAHVADQQGPVSRARLAGLLWSDHPEEQARTSLRVALSRTRHHVVQLQSDRSNVWLDGDVSLDLTEIEAASIDRVLESYRGDAFASVEADRSELFNDWIVRRREEHRIRVMRSLSGGARAAADEGRWADVATIGRRMIDVEPWNEVAHRFVMSAAAVTDGRSSALAAFARCTDALRDEFGVTPDEETEQLAASIRDRVVPSLQPSLQPPVAAPARSITWRLLGDVAVVIDGVAHDLGGRHRRSVMAQLAVSAPETCSLGTLVASVWGDDAPATAEQSIRRHVRELQALAPELRERIERVPDGFRLAALPHEVDAFEARTIIATARSNLRHGATEAGVIALRDAVSLWDGATLGGVTRHGRLATARVSLDELRLGAIEDLIEAELVLDRHREIASEAEAFALEHPTRERAWANLMLTRSRTGRRGEAVEAYREFCDALADAGLLPSRSIAALHRQIVEESPAVRPRDATTSATESPWTLPMTTFSVPLPTAFDRSTQVPLAGRRTEMSRLEEALADASASPATVFVAGEPGIGKTRIVAEFARSAHQSGAAVLYGRCDDSLGMPFRAWREALTHLAEHVPHHIARRHLDRFGNSLHLLIPSLVDDTSTEHVVERTDAIDPSRRELLFGATTDFLGDVAKRRRVVIVIDDMQWAHDSTIDLMRHVARNADEPIRMICVYRTTDVAPGHPVRDVVAELEQAGLATVMVLDELDQSARADLARSVIGHHESDIAEKVAEKVAEETGGNPFFFTEVLRSLQETGTVTSVLETSSIAATPPNVHRVIDHRVSRLGDTAAATLRSASLFGREFDLGVLSAVVDRVEDDVLDDVEAAVAAGLLIDAPSGRDRFAFTHDLLHHTLAADLSQSRRGRLHGRIAHEMERIHGPELGDHLPVVAEHLVAADDPSLRDHAITRCRDAGRHAAHRLATSEACAWFQLALDRLGPERDGERAGLLVELGTQQRNAALPEHRSTLIEAGRVAQSRGDTETLVAAALINSRGMNAHVWELDDERIAMLRSALAARGDDEPTQRAELLAALANEQWDPQHRADAEAFYREALTIARHADDPEALARVLVRVSRARNFRLDRDEMIAASNELRQLTERVDRRDPLLLANCLTTVLNTSIRLGLAVETRDAIDAICSTAEALPLPMFTLPAHLARCLDAGLRGDIDAYEKASVETFHHATSIGDEEAGFIFEGQMFYTAYLRGGLAPILDFSIRVMRDRPDVPLYRAVCTLIHVEAGAFDEAVRLLDSEVTAGIEPSVDMFQIQALVAWADAAASLEHRPASAQLYDALIALSSEMSGHLVQVGEPIDISLGRLASVLDRFHDAARHFDRADAIAASFDAAWMQAKTDVSRAEMLVRRNQDDDLETAGRLADAVHRRAEQLGFRGVATRAAQLLAGPARSV